MVKKFQYRMRVIHDIMVHPLDQDGMHYITICLFYYCHLDARFINHKKYIHCATFSTLLDVKLTVLILLLLALQSFLKFLVVRNIDLVN